MGTGIKTKSKYKKMETQPGMGAISKSRHGTTFRVWAPHAEKVSVVGDFNVWNEEEHVMQDVGHGCWSLDIPKIKEGMEYKFAVRTKNGSVLRNDPFARQMTNSNGNSVVAKRKFTFKNGDFKIADRNKLMIYEMHIGTFNRDEKKNKVGTFKSAQKKLGYLKELGINAIELMPVAEFAGGISWGYNPAAPFAIESDYGGPKAFAEFVDKAHGHGIAVLIDVVYNHFGPSDTDMWQFDGWSENDKGGIYFYNDHRSKTPWGDTRPDYGRVEVRQFIRDNALMWLEDYNCDGLRWDATSYIRYVEGGVGYHREEIAEAKRMIQDINGEIQTKYPEKVLIAEDLKADAKVTMEQGYDGLNFDAQWDSEFVHPVKEVLIKTDDASRNLQEIVNALTFRYNDDAFERVVYTESHDEVANGKSRIPEEIQPGEADSAFAKKRSVLGAVLVLTAPGIPMIFQGQEFLENGYFEDTDGIDWKKATKFKGIQKLYRDLIKLRIGNPADELRGLQGQRINILHFNQSNKMLAYTRSHDDYGHCPVLVIINFSNTLFDNYDIGVPIGGLWETAFNSSWDGYDKEDFSLVNAKLHMAKGEPYDNQPHKLTFSIAGYGALILKGCDETKEEYK